VWVPVVAIVQSESDDGASTPADLQRACFVATLTPPEHPTLADDFHQAMRNLHTVMHERDGTNTSKTEVLYREQGHWKLRACHLPFMVQPTFFFLYHRNYNCLVQTHRQWCDGTDDTLATSNTDKCCGTHLHSSNNAISRH